MTFLVVRNTNTVLYQVIFSTTFSYSSLNKLNRGIPNAATGPVEGVFMQGILIYKGFTEKLGLKLKTVKYICISPKREMWMYSPKTSYPMRKFEACGT